MLEDRLLRLEDLLEVHRLIAEYSHGADKRELQLISRRLA